MSALVLIRWFYRYFGRRASVALLTPIVAYFFVTGRAARRASMDYLRTLWAMPRGRAALGEAPTWRHVFRHLHEFAENILDRMIVWSGDAERIQIDDQATEHLLDLVRERRGALLLSAHIGSYDMLRLLSERTGIVLNVLMFTQHSARINSFFERLYPELAIRLIHFEPGSIDAAFEMKAAIDRGEFVGILGDRVWESEHDRSDDRTVPRATRTRPARCLSAPGGARLPDPSHRVRPHGTWPLYGDGAALCAGRLCLASESRQARGGARPTLRDLSRRVVPPRAVSVVQLFRVLARRRRSYVSRRHGDRDGIVLAALEQKGESIDALRLGWATCRY